MLRSSTRKLPHQRQAPPKHQRMPECSYSPEKDHHSRLHDAAETARSLPLQGSGTFDNRVLHTDDQQMMGGSTSSSFSQPATSGLLMESGSAQFFGTQSTDPLHHPTFIEMKRSNTGLRQDAEFDFALDGGLMDGSGHNSMPVSQDVLTPQEFSWRQHDHRLFEHQFNTSVDTDYASYGLSFPQDDHMWPPEFIPDPALDFPGAIKIGGSSGHYNANLPSSFPPSADCLPNYISPMQVPRRHGAAASTSEPNSLPSSPPILPFQKRPNKPAPTRASRSGSLSIIREYGHTQHGSPTLSRNGSGKGKRKGPLPTATALAAAQKRKDGSVCIRCRTMKMTVRRQSRTSREQADDVVV